MSEQISKRGKVAKGLIWMGVLAWVPYFFVKVILGGEVQILPFLVIHLTGVLGGGFLKTFELMQSKKSSVE